MKFIPAVMASIDPELYAQAKDHLLDMSYADYFYITAYPVYGGYRIEHDPTITAYCQLTSDVTPEEPAPTGGAGAIILIVIGVILLAGFLVVIRKKK